MKKKLISILIGSMVLSSFAIAETREKSDLSVNIETQINKEHSQYDTIDITKGALIKMDKSVSDILKLIGSNASGIKTGPDFTISGKAPVMVFFDTQCPYCKNLWQSSLADINKDVSVYWIPISVIDDYKSLKEGAVFLESQSNPYEIMDMIGNKEGYQINVAESYYPEEKSQNDVLRNTLLFHKLGFNSVPLTLKITQSGDVYAQYGDVSALDLNKISQY